MAIKINFDITHNPEMPTFVLAKKNGDKIGILDAKETEVSDSLNDASEITFVVYKYTDGKKCEYWEQIVDFKLVYCVEWDVWFEITVELDESNETKKTIYCTRLGQAELSQVKLYNIEINTENDIARDDYESPTILFNPLNSSVSLLHRIMEKAPHYKVIHVDNTIADIQRTFTFDNVSIYDAFQQIAEEIHCLFVFHSNSDENGNVQRTISVYDLESNCLTCGHRGEFTSICPQCGNEHINEGYGNDTTIFITSDELADEIQLTSDTDSIKNCFKLEAGDDLMTSTIRNCNPNGTDYIWYISDALKADMSQELVEKIDLYNKTYSDYQKTHKMNLPEALLEQYNTLVDKYLSYDDSLEKINTSIVGYSELMNAYYNTIDLYQFLEHSLMPSVKMMETNAIKEAEKLTTESLSPVSVNSLNAISIATADNAVLSMAKIIVDSRYKIKVTSSELTDSGANKIWNGKFIITNYADEEDIATSSNVSVVINDNYGEFVKQKLQKSLNKDDTDDLSISSLFSKEYNDFILELNKYSLSCLNSFYNSCQTCIDILIEQGIGNKDTWDGAEDNLYEDLYLAYLNKMTAIESEIKERQSEIDLIVGVYDSNGDLKTRGIQNYIEDIKLEIQKELDFQKYLGKDLWLEFCTFRREDKFSNSNYISDGLNNAELFKRAYEFIEIAQKEIYKSAELQHSISTTLKNLLTIKKFKPIIKDFEVGNWLRIMVDDELYKLRLIHYSIDYTDLNNISVTFSDVTKASSTIKSVQEVLAQATSMATSYESTQRQAKQGEESRKFLDDWVNKGLDITNAKIMNDATNQTQTWDEHGMLFKKYDTITDTFEDTQLKIINSTLAITDDNWKSVKTAVGAYFYFNPETGELTKAYGINAETLVGKLILGEQLGIYNKSGTLTFDNNGFKITSQNGNNSFRVDPNSSTLLAINNGTQDVFFIDNNGKLHIVGDGAGLDIANNANITGLQSQVLINSDAIKLRVTNEEMHSAITTEINKVKIEVANDNAGLLSKIEANTNSINLEVNRAKVAEDSLSSKINVNTDNITLEVNRAKGAENELSNKIVATENSFTVQLTDAKNSLSSQIKANTDSIELKVSKGDVSSQISVESGTVTIGSNRMIIDSDNFKLDKSGQITATGSITTENGSSKTMVNSGGVYFYNNNELSGYLSGNSVALDGSMSNASTVGHPVINLKNYQDAFIISTADYYYFAFNNGLNPFGMTERFWFGDTSRFIDVVHINNAIRFEASGIYNENATVQLKGAESIEGETNLAVSKSFVVHGNLSCSGEKNRLVETENYGVRKLNAMESSVALFSDVGSATIDVAGVVYIYIDPVFIETIDNIHEYQIFITPLSQGEITEIEKQSNYFVVYGTPNMKFDWMMLARQKGYAHQRLEQFGELLKDDEQLDTNYIFYDDDKGADASAAYMETFNDTLDEQAETYLREYEQEVIDYDY